MTAPPEPRPTADGVPTLYCPRAGQTYHSLRGALAESSHVFLRLGGVEDALRRRQPLHILEIGLGAALNLAVSAAAVANTGGSLHYTAAEPEPLAPHLLLELGYHSLLPDALRGPYRDLVAALHAARPSAWVRATWRTPGATLNVAAFRGPAQSLHTSIGPVDVVYHDAFSPSAAPDLWTPAFFAHLHTLTLPGGRLTTYSTAGATRRALAAAGWDVERHPGPPGGKREVLRALRRPFGP